MYNLILLQAQKLITLIFLKLKFMYIPTTGSLKRVIGGISTYVNAYTSMQSYSFCYIVYITL